MEAGRHDTHYLGAHHHYGWQWRLDDATSAAEVVEVTRDFLATWTPEEFAALPEDCRPGKIVDGDDVADIAFTLVQRSCEDAHLSDERLQRMAGFFTHALQRLSQLRAHEGSLAQLEH